MSKLATFVASALVLIGLAGFTAVARADDTHTFRGTVASFNPAAMTFTLVTPHSGNVMVKLDGDTQYTDRDGSVRHFSDLNNGDNLKIKGDFSDSATSVDNVNQVIFRSDSD